MPLLPGSQVIYDWMACTRIIGDELNGVPSTITAPNGPYAEGSTPVYAGQIVDVDQQGVPASAFRLLYLTILDALTGAVINGCDQVSILNVGRGRIDSQGNLTIQLEAGDTDTSEQPGAAVLQRTMIISWAYVSGSSSGSGSHAVNFLVQAFPVLPPSILTEAVIVAGAL